MMSSCMIFVIGLFIYSFSTHKARVKKFCPVVFLFVVLQDKRLSRTRGDSSHTITTNNGNYFIKKQDHAIYIQEQYNKGKKLFIFNYLLCYNDLISCMFLESCASRYYYYKLFLPVSLLVSIILEGLYTNMMSSHQHVTQIFFGNNPLRNNK